MYTSTQQFYLLYLRPSTLLHKHVRVNSIANEMQIYHWGIVYSNNAYTTAGWKLVKRFSVMTGITIIFRQCDKSTFNICWEIIKVNYNKLNWKKYNIWRLNDCDKSRRTLLASICLNESMNWYRYPSPIHHIFQCLYIYIPTRYIESVPYHN